MSDKMGKIVGEKIENLTIIIQYGKLTDNYFMESELKNQVNSWKEFCKFQYADNTLIMYSLVLKQFMNFVESRDRPINREAVHSYLKSKLSEGCSRSLYNRYLTAIRGFMNYRSEVYGINSPIDGLKFIKQDPPKQRVLSEVEYKKIINFVKDVEQDIIVFFGNTGLRRREFFNLLWDDFDLELKRVVVRGKGRKQRVVPLNDNCREVILRYRRVHGSSFQPARKFSNEQSLSWLCRKVAYKLKLPLFGTHALRHYFATQMIKKGVNIYKLSKVLGHSSVTTTEKIYLHLAPVDLFGFTDCLDC